MKTITSKTAKNGAQLWYVDGKRTSRDKAVEADIENGRETLSKLTAGLRADPAVYNDFGIVVEMNDILGGRYSEYFYFATAQDAVTAARKIVALGSEQIARVVIDNGRPYPANVRYADTVDGKLIFLNGFERFDETNKAVEIDGYDESAFDLLPTVDELNDVEIDDEAKTEFARKVADKLFRVERFSQEQVDAVVAAILDDNHDAAAVKKLIDDFKAENFNEAQKIAQRLDEIIAAEEAAAKADEPQNYIFSKTLVSSGYSAHNNAHYSKLERIDKECKILGNSEQTNGSIYREVAFYNADHAHSWAVKTSDGKVIISGKGKPDFDKIVAAVNNDEAKTDEPATETVNLDGITETNNDGEDGFTGEDFLKELTVTLDINAAVKKILATADNFRFLDQRHEISLTKPDSEIMWERDFRGYKGDETFLVTEVYNHPDGTLREVYLRGDGLPVTVKIAEPNRNMKLTADTVKAEFDKAVKDSIENYGARLEVNGETLTFEDGKVIEVGSTRYGAYFTIRNGRRIFFYRGNRVSKQDFFGHIETEDKALDQRAAIGEFVGKFGGSEILPGLNPQRNFVAQIHPTLANGRQDNYFATFESKDDAHAFIAEFKKLTCGMKFMATIKRGSFYGEVIYRHGLKGQEFFATDDTPDGKDELNDVDDTDNYFELADELDEIGGDICDTKEILERKIANGAPQTEIKLLEGYIDEREGEYRALHKRIYGVEEQADNKVYPIDIAIYHGGSALTEAELEDTAAQFRTAITANGNFGKVEVEESYLSVIGDIGGDNKTIWKLIGDLCWRGDCVLESWDAETEELREMPGIEIDGLLERMGIDNEPLAFEIPAYDAAVKKIFGSDAGAIFTPGGHLTVEVAV